MTRKRKSMGVVEDHDGRPEISKSRRTTMKETEKNVHMTTSMYSLGAKSFCERGTTYRLRRETTNWVEWKLDESGRLPGELTKKTRIV